MDPCPLCNSTGPQHKHGKTRYGIERYLCSACGKTYTARHAARRAIRQQSVEAFLAGKNLRLVARQFDICQRTLIHWLQKEIGERVLQSISEKKDIRAVSQETGLPENVLSNWYSLKYGELSGFGDASNNLASAPKHLSKDLFCPYCGDEANQRKRGFTIKGDQRYECKICRRRYIRKTYYHSYSPLLKNGVINRYKEIKSFGRVSKQFAVPYTTCRRWILDALAKEDDDLYSFIKTNRMDTQIKKR